MMIVRSLVLLSLLFSSASSQVYACASCGSGSDDPLILYPNEDWKLYLGFSRNLNYKNITPDGKESGDGGGPDRKDTWRAAIGKSFGLRSFATLTIAKLINRRSNHMREGTSDPSLAGRYTLVLPDMTETWIPQVQLMASYKPAFARSIYESKNLYSLDVFGTGFPEYKLGLDLWYGLNPVKFGAAYIYTKHQSKSYDGVKYQPGDIHRFTVTGGYMWLMHFKTMLGVNREMQGVSKAGSRELPKSAKLAHSYFFNQDYQMDVQNLFRLSYSKHAGMGTNRNTTKSDSIGLAYMRSF